MKTTLSQFLLFTFLILFPIFLVGQQSIDQKLGNYKNIESESRKRFSAKHIHLGLEIMQDYRKSKKFEAALAFGTQATAVYQSSKKYEKFYTEFAKEIQITLTAMEGQKKFEPIARQYWALYNKSELILFTKKNSPSKTNLPKYLQDVESIAQKYGRNSETYTELLAIYWDYLAASPELLTRVLTAELTHLKSTDALYKECSLELLFCQIKIHEQKPNDLLSSHNWYALHLDSIEQLSDKRQPIYKEASAYVKYHFYGTNKELDFFFKYHAHIKDRLQEKSSSFWRNGAISTLTTFEEYSKKGGSIGAIFRQALDEYDRIAESSLKKYTSKEHWIAYKLSRLTVFCTTNSPDEKNFDQYVQHIVAIQSYVGLDNRASKKAWSIVKEGFPLTGTIFDQLIDWQTKNLEENWEDQSAPEFTFKIKELYAEKIVAKIHAYAAKISSDQELSTSYSWYAAQIDSIETLVGANHSLFNIANLQVSKELFKPLDYPQTTGLEDELIRSLVITNWSITDEGGRFWNTLMRYFSNIERYPLKEDWLGNQIQKNRVEHERKIILYIKKQSKGDSLVFSNAWLRYLRFKIRFTLHEKRVNEKTTLAFKKHLEEAEDYLGLGSMNYVELWDLVYYNPAFSEETKKRFLNWRMDRIKANAAANKTNTSSTLFSQLRAEIISHEIKMYELPEAPKDKKDTRVLQGDFDWCMIRLDSVLNLMGNKHWLTEKTWEEVYAKFEEVHTYNLSLKKWQFYKLQEGGNTTDLNALSPQNKVTKTNILLYELSYCPPNKTQPSLDYDWYNLQLDSIQTLIGIDSRRFSMAWTITYNKYRADKATKRKFLRHSLNKAEASPGFIDSPKAMFLIYSIVNFYSNETTSDEDLNKKLQVFRTRISQHGHCPPNSAETFTIVEQMPRFYGCEDMEGDNRAKKECADKIMLDFIYSNLNYPPLAKDNEIEGMAVISFTVTTCGTLTDIKILRDPGGNIGKEALRIMRSMNYLLEVPFVAGKQRGQKVQVRYNIPIRFKIEKTE